MKTELVIFLIVAVIAAIGFVQVKTTGMDIFAQNTLEDYPKYFFTNNAFNAVIIKGNMEQPEETLAANMLVNQLSRYTTYPEGMQNKIIASDKVDYTATNAIVIGIPCHNYAVSALLGITNCNTYFKPGEGLIKLVMLDENTCVVVTGYSGREVFNAALLLTSHTKIKGTEIKILTKKMQEAVYVPLDIGEPVGGWNR
jgi:hypothetical protein